MPRYFFDVVDGECQTRDDEGLTLPDIEAARREAISSLLDVARDELPDGDHRVFVVKIRSDDDRYLLTAQLAFDANWLERAG